MDALVQQLVSRFNLTEAQAREIIRLVSDHVEAQLDDSDSNYVGGAGGVGSPLGGLGRGTVGTDAGPEFDEAMRRMGEASSPQHRDRGQTGNTGGGNAGTSSVSRPSDDAGQGYDDRLREMGEGSSPRNR